MPVVTPAIKINGVKMHGEDWVTVILIGSVFDDAQKASLKFAVI